MSYRWLGAALAIFLLLSPDLGQGESPPGIWTQVDDEDGIKVWRLDVPGQDLPGFKGETVIPRSIADIVTELKQVEHHTEWMHRCSASETIRRFDDEHQVEADVGGAVPKWMAARVARDMPYETLAALRKRVVEHHPAR